MMRKTLLAAAWGIILLFGADHASAEDPSSPFLKLCEAETVMPPALRLRMGQSRLILGRKKRKKNPPAPLRTSPYPNDCKT